jgi:hypothetical protein
VNAQTSASPVRRPKFHALEIGKGTVPVKLGMHGALMIDRPDKAAPAVIVGGAPLRPAPAAVENSSKIQVGDSTSAVKGLSLLWTELVIEGIWGRLQRNFSIKTVHAALDTEPRKHAARWDGHRAGPTVSAIFAPRRPSGFGAPVVLSRAVWCSVSAFSLAPTRMTMIESQIHIMKPMTAPSEP